MSQIAPYCHPAEQAAWGHQWLCASQDTPEMSDAPVVDGDLLPGLGGIGQVLADGVLDLELASLFEQQDAGGGELLGQGAEAELHRGSVGET